jgi:radical SAM superfamily enzyme YgiQ (UPF0313 family)
VTAAVSCGKKRVRFRDVRSVIDELKHIKSNYPHFNYIYFEDDVFFLRDRSELEWLMRSYKQEIGIPFNVLITPREVTPENLDLIKNAGVGEVAIGIQSGNEMVRKELYRRPLYSNQNIVDAHKRLHTYSIPIKYDIITDTPWEGDEIESFRLLKRMQPPFRLGVFALTIYPGAEIEKIVPPDYLEKRKDKYLTDNYYTANIPSFLHYIMKGFGSETPSIVPGRDKLSQKWSLESEPLWGWSC